MYANVNDLISVQTAPSGALAALASITLPTLNLPSEPYQFTTTMFLLLFLPSHHFIHLGYPSTPFNPPSTNNNADFAIIDYDHYDSVIGSSSWLACQSDGTEVCS